MNHTATLPALVQDQLASLRSGWMFVGAAFQADSEHCDSCKHNQVIGRFHYEAGLHRAYVEGAACTLGRKDGEHPGQCPAYAAHLASDEGVTL